MEVVLKVEGMHCEGCENRIQNAVSKIDGVEEVKASHEKKEVKLTIESEEVLPSVKEKLDDLGFTVE